MTAIIALHMEEVLAAMMTCRCNTSSLIASADEQLNASLGLHCCAWLLADLNLVMDSQKTTC
jgi:hypothetical protein